MFNIKKYTWILVLISAILIIMLSFVPNFNLIDTEEGNHYFAFLFGIAIDFYNGAFEEIDVSEPPVIISGAIFTLILLGIGIFLLVSAITSRNKESSKIGLLWVIFGLIIFLMPFSLRVVNGINDLLFQESHRWFLYYPLDLFLGFTTIGGAMVVSSGVIMMADFTELQLR